MRVLALVETTLASHAASRRWQLHLWDGTAVTAQYMCRTSYLDRTPHFPRGGLRLHTGWETAVDRIDGDTLSAYGPKRIFDVWYGPKPDPFIPSAEDDAAVVAQLASVDITQLPDSVMTYLWDGSVGRYLADLGIPLDNERALRILGADVLSGARPPTDLELRAVTRLYPS